MRIPSPAQVAEQAAAPSRRSPRRASSARSGPDRLFRAAQRAAPLGRRRRPPATRPPPSASPTSRAIIDEAGTLTFQRGPRAHQRARPRAGRRGRRRRATRVAIMCRNHRGFIEALRRALKLGAHALFLNTAFAGPQLADVAQREEPAALDLRRGVRRACSRRRREGRKRFVAWHDPASDAPTTARSRT